MILKKQKGLSLIEALLGWAMVAIFLSSAMRIQGEFLRKNRVHREKMMAQWQLESMAERLLSNQTTESRNREFIMWKEENQALFPKSKSELHCAGKNCEIRLEWGRGLHVELRV